MLVYKQDENEIIIIINMERYPSYFALVGLRKLFSLPSNYTHYASYKTCVSFKISRTALVRIVLHFFMGLFFLFCSNFFIGFQTVMPILFSIDIAHPLTSVHHLRALITFSLVIVRLLLLTRSKMSCTFGV